MANKLIQAELPADQNPTFISLKAPRGALPLSVERGEEGKVLILLLGDVDQPESTVELVMAGVGQDLPNVAAWINTPNFTLRYLGAVSRESKPYAYYHMWHVQHFSPIIMPNRSTEIPFTPNGNA